MFVACQQHRNERGSASVEFVLILPVLAMGMLFLIGLGYTLMTKQNAIVGARAAVYFRAWDHPPEAGNLSGRIKNAISPGREEWRVLALREPIKPDPDLEDVGRSEPDLDVKEGENLLQRAIGAIYQMLNQEIAYEVNTTPTLGYLPAALKLDSTNLVRARSSYYLPHRTWTCKQSGGASYFAIGTSAGLSAVGVQMSKFPDKLRELMDPGCCETYNETYEGGP